VLEKISVAMKVQRKQNPKKEVSVKAPSGYHWMTKQGRYYLMPHEGKFKEHEGASLEAPFKVITQH
jgi:hypothetical protein